MVFYHQMDAVHEPFFDLNGNVGWGCPNNQDDVMLVQLYLRRYFQKLYYDMDASDWNPEWIVTVDGILGGKTVNAILAFQRSCPDVPYKDGKVNRTQSTIAMLNSYYEDFYPEYNKKPYLDPEAPALLKYSTATAEQVGPVLG